MAFTEKKTKNQKDGVGGGGGGGPGLGPFHMKYVSAKKIHQVQFI